MNKKITLLSVGLVAAIAAVGTSMALIYGDAVTKTTEGALEAGAVLKFGTGGTDSISNLVYGTPVTGTVVISKPVASTTVSANDYVSLAFTLTDSTTTTKLKVEISEVEWGVAQEDDITTLQGDKLTYTDYIKISEFSDATMVYNLRFSLLSNPESGENPSGSLLVEYNYVSAADYSSANQQ